MGISSQGRTIGGRCKGRPLVEAAGAGEAAIRWNMLGKTVVCLLRRWRLGGAWHDGDLHGTTEGVTKPGFRWGRGASTAQEQADTAACWMLRWRRLGFRWGAGSGYKNRG